MRVVLGVPILLLALLGCGIWSATDAGAPVAATMTAKTTALAKITAAHAAKTAPTARSLATRSATSLLTRRDPSTTTQTPLRALARILGRSQTAAASRPSGGAAADAAAHRPRGVRSRPRPVHRHHVEGADVSWPQCPPGIGGARRALGLSMPLSTAKYVVLGLTDGPGFVTNPCLPGQVAWVKHHHLLAGAYSVISAPAHGQIARYGRRGPYDGSTVSGRWANLGYQEARFNVATMRAVGLQSPTVWLDIEPVSHPAWTPNKAANASVVRGATRGYRAAGLTVGVYSLPLMWHDLVGDLRLRLPEWRPAGVIERDGWAAALRRCGGEWSFQGGAAVLGQWTSGDRDRDVTCPGHSVHLSRWFHQY